jgi:hypothetical protein
MDRRKDKRYLKVGRILVLATAILIFSRGVPFGEEGALLKKNTARMQEML